MGSGTCAQLSYSDIPADGVYYVTTFGGGADTQTMSCGGTADATWAYAADRARFGCGTKLLVQAGGKQCVVEVADCGPNRCVEEAACGCSCGGHHPMLDVSPFVTQYLLGSSAVGWSEKRAVTANAVDAASTIGCPGNAVGGGGSGGSTGNGGSGATSGGGGTGATGGSGGSPTSGCDVAPHCDDCVGCLSDCVCHLADVNACNSICNSGGSGGASGGSGGAASCALPTCFACPDCYSRCMCEAGDKVVCTGVCNQSGSGGGGAAGGAPLGSPGCDGADCGSCATCADHCTCVTQDKKACAAACGQTGTGGSPAADPLDQVSRCDCSTPGRRSDGRGGVLALAMLGWMLFRRGNRERSVRG